MSNKDSNQLFDTKTEITALYLWLMFGFLSTMVSCDFRRWLMENIWFRHFVGIIAFFFLFAVIDSSNKLPITSIWLKSIGVYFLFLMMIKSKWYFSLPLFITLIIDQSLKIHYEHLKNNNPTDSTLPSIENIRNYLTVLIYALIVIGFVAYGLRQYKEFGSAFSWIKLLLHYGCKGM